MPRFAYTGRAASGAVSGELDGADAGAVATVLMSRGVTPLQISADGAAGARRMAPNPVIWRCPSCSSPRCCRPT